MKHRRNYHLRTERWYDVKDYEGLYQFSNFGKFKSFEHWSNGKHFKEKILKGGVCGYATKDGSQYRKVSLSKDGKVKSFLIHRLVAESLIPNPNNYSDVNHKDEHKDNNCVWNLEWMKHKDNCDYGDRNNKVSQNQKRKYGSDNQFYGKHHTKETIEKIIEHYNCKVICNETGEIFMSPLEAAKNFNVSKATIMRSIKHKKPLSNRTQFSGLTFEYLRDILKENDRNRQITY